MQLTDHYRRIQVIQQCLIGIAIGDIDRLGVDINLSAQKTIECVQRAPGAVE